MPEMMEQGGNPDAAQDESLIQSVIERELGPIFEAIGSRLRDYEEDLGELKDMFYKFAEGLIGASDNHKRTMLSDEISSKYGKDMEPFDGFYKDVHGKGFMDSILEELMGEGAPDETGRDEWMQNKLNEAKGKYGKYVGIKAEIPAEAPPAEEVKEEVAEAPAEQAAEEEMGSEEEGADVVSGLMKQMKSLGGRKHKLSEAPKKE